MTKLDLSKLDNIESPSELDDHILKEANEHISPLARKKSKRVVAYVLAYSFGMLSIIFGSYLFDSARVNYVPEIYVNEMTLRGAEKQSTQKIDIEKLSEAEKKDLVVELVLKGELKQAESLLNWMNKQKE